MKRDQEVIDLHLGLIKPAPVFTCTSFIKRHKGILKQTQAPENIPYILAL